VNIRELLKYFKSFQEKSKKQEFIDFIRPCLELDIQIYIEVKEKVEHKFEEKIYFQSKFEDYLRDAQNEQKFLKVSELASCLREFSGYLLDHDNEGKFYD
jgi:hypothetical protein